MSDFEIQSRALSRDVEAALDALLSSDRLAGPGAPPERLVAAMRHGSLNGGKRLRPLLVRQTAALFGVPAEAALPAGLAVEMIHCYSLIHDDLPAMDDDDMRRGRPTVHKAYDEATAILAGDALLTQAFATLAGAGYAPDTTVRLIGVLAAAAGAGGMVGGQMRDIEGETAPLAENEIARMQAMKTGALFSVSVQMGALLGEPTAKQLDALLRYGDRIGRAFQLADDILDVTASAEAMGKATGKDAGAGKQTLVARIGVEAAQRRLAELTHDALSALSGFGDEAEGLRATARYVAARER